MSRRVRETLAEATRLVELADRLELAPGAALEQAADLVEQAASELRAEARSARESSA